MKLFIFVFFGIWCLWFGISDAQERGIGVSPAKIEIQGIQEWPYEAPIFVTNFSPETEQFEILFEKDTGTEVSTTPGRFTLEGGASKRVLLTFDKSKQTGEGVVKVVSKQTSPEGFTTGTGIKIPFSVQGVEGANDARFFAGVGNIVGGGISSWIFGSGLMLLALFVLWYISDTVRTWILNSSRH